MRNVTCVDTKCHNPRVASDGPTGQDFSQVGPDLACFDERLMVPRDDTGALKLSLRHVTCLHGAKTRTANATEMILGIDTPRLMTVVETQSQMFNNTPTELSAFFVAACCLGSFLWLLSAQFCLHASAGHSQALPCRLSRIRARHTQPWKPGP